MQSLISPEKIIGSRSISPESFSKFMSGGKDSIGDSVMKSAANNIVNFARGGVRPANSNIASLVKNISTNISTPSIEPPKNVVNQEQIQNISKNIIQNVNKSVSTTVNDLRTQVQNVTIQFQKQSQTTLNNLIQNFTRDYQRRIQEKDDVKPTNVLKNFLGLYRNAVDLVTFFGDERNNKRIRNSIKSLTRIFNETFDVAIAIRQAIVRIVRQLSNLPTASGNAPDLNLDVNVPGGRLRQSGGSSIGQFARSRFGRALGFTAAGLGGVALGAGVASMGRNKAERFQEEKLQATAKGESKEQMAPEGLLDGLERIIDKFTSAIENLIGGPRKKPESSSGSSGSSSGAPPPSPDSSAGSAAAVNMADFSEEDKSYLGRMIAAEVGTNPNQVEAASVMNVALNRLRTIKQGISTPEAWGIKGKSREEVTLKDVMSVTSQWQPLQNNSFNRITNEQGNVALNAAVRGFGNDPEKFRQYLLSIGASEEAATNIALSTSFYNPKLSGNTPFPGSRYDKIPGLLGRHAFGQATPGNRLERFGPPYQATIEPKVPAQVGVQTSTTRPSTSTSPQGTVTPTNNLQSSVKPQPASTQIASAARIQSTQPRVDTKVVNLPPNITMIPGSQEQPSSGGKIIDPPSTGGESAFPDVSMMISASNPENPNRYFVNFLGVLNA